jgi:hypothetical protein
MPGFLGLGPSKLEQVAVLEERYNLVEAEIGNIMFGGLSDFGLISTQQNPGYIIRYNRFFSGLPRPKNFILIRRGDQQIVVGIYEKGLYQVIADCRKGSMHWQCNEYNLYYTLDQAKSFVLGDLLPN